MPYHYTAFRPLHVEPEVALEAASRTCAAIGFRVDDRGDDYASFVGPASGAATAAESVLGVDQARPLLMSNRIGIRVGNGQIGVAVERRDHASSYGCLIAIQSTIAILLATGALFLGENGWMWVLLILGTWGVTVLLQLGTLSWSASKIDRAIDGIAHNASRGL